MITPLNVSWYLLAVDIYLDTHINDVLFTGKLVKSLLIDANPKLKEVFAKTSGSIPKLVHVTPLYQSNNGKVRCLYSYAVENSGGGWRIERVLLNPGVYRFYIGFVEASSLSTLSFDEVYSTILNISGVHEFMNYTVKAEVSSITLVDVASRAKSIVKRLVKNSEKLRVVFSSPTLLKDPVRDLIESSEHKSFVPTPMNIFSTPVYILRYLGGLAAGSTKETLEALHRIINETHSYLGTVERRWIVYEKGKNPIPTLIGYVNLRLNRKYYEYYNKICNVDKLLESAFTAISSLGTGTSRASGFGHVELTVKS